MQDQEVPIEKEIFLTPTLYSKPQCVQCTATERKLKDQKIDYNYVNIAEDPEALAKIKELGYLQAPVVVVGDMHWSGFRPDYIDKYIAS